MSWTTYKEKVKHLSERLVDLQRPIRILDAIQWPANFDQELIRAKFKGVPKVGPEYYQSISLNFDPTAKKQEFKQLKKDIELELGGDDEVGKLLATMADEYDLVVEMLAARGTKRFYELSRRLYGSPCDSFYGDNIKIRDLGIIMYEILGGLEGHGKTVPAQEELSAEETVDILNKRFLKFFGDDSISAKLSDGLLADAAAGGDSVKIREGSKFTRKEIDILEVHEGWVHVGTTQNGSNQTVAKWLAKGPPRCASTQEGLAVIMEIFTFRTFPKRAKTINDRIIGIDKAESGASFLDVFEFYRTEGYSEEDCITNTKRVFRGGVLDGGAPFTKDIAYCRGFIENYNFMRAAVRAGRPELLQFLFVGKLHTDDVPLLYQKYLEGLIDAPKFLPRTFKDPAGVIVWMSFSNFFNMINLERIQEHYGLLFKKYL